jgi:hypothetical protein
MSQKVFIHLGPHKTASTYIQTRLLHNANPLYEAGCYYPPPTTLGPGHALIANELMAGISHAFCSIFSDQASSGAKNVIISSENLINLSMHQLDSVFHLIPSKSEIHLVYALRPALQQLKSLFQEKLKAGHPLEHECIADWINLLQSNDLSGVYLSQLLTLAYEKNAVLHFLEINTEDSVDPFFQFCECLGLTPSEINSFDHISDVRKGSNISAQPLTQLQLSWLNCFLRNSDKSLNLSTRERTELASLLLRGKTAGMLKDERKNKSHAMLQKSLNELAKSLIQPPPEVISMCQSVDSFRCFLTRSYIRADSSNKH